MIGRGRCGARARRCHNKGFARRPQDFLEGLYAAIPAFGGGSGSGSGSGELRFRKAAAGVWEVVWEEIIN